MSSRLIQSLTKLFERHRIVFWYDAKQELRDEYEALSLPGIEKLEISNNEYGIKYRLLLEEPEQKFLLYHHGPQPADLENWLLDVLLAHGEFHANQASIWLSEMELSLEFVDIVQEHSFFFHAAKRREALKKLLAKDDTPGRIRLKMLAVCASAEPRLDEIIESLLGELAQQGEEKINLLQRCELAPFFWLQLNREYGYISDTPGMLDFTLELFKSCYAMGLEQHATLFPVTLVFLQRWKDSMRHHAAFETLSAQCAVDLNIEQQLQQRDYRSLLEMDYFRLIDQKISSSLLELVVARTISANECEAIVRQRRSSHWYAEFEHLYLAIQYAAQFLQALDEVDFTMQSLADGVQCYTRSWQRIDFLYRKCLHHTRQSGQPSLLEGLTTMVENRYSTNYLLKLNDLWQQYVDACPAWEADDVLCQRYFYARKIREDIDKERKVVVIISDALRYEVGEELLSLIRQEDRYDAIIEPMLAMLPSYTQLGMAALLPNSEIAIADNDTGTVFVDGQSTQGTANRVKILNQAVAGNALALRAEDFLRQTKDECRALVRDHNLIYLYQNRIDAVGDKMESEERVFDAVEDALQELVKLIKKLTTANVTNMLVTADHGFLFQQRPIEESDFLGVEATGQEIRYRDRRFVLGKGLTPHASFRLFTSAELGLAGEMEVLIPKSINRLRLKGSGSRYVHGGASLQEVIIPLITINKKRQSDICNVEVDILRGTTSTITSGQISAPFYQAQAVTDKVQPRRLRAGIYTRAGKLISDQHDLLFDLTSENPREREKLVRFLLTREADEANNQQVTLRLEEQIAGTSKYRDYKSISYTIRRSFTSDFDF